MLFTSIYTFGQELPPLIQVCDEFGEKTILSTRKIIISNDDYTKGFTLDVFFANKIVLSSIMIGFNGCNENDKIIILLDNDEKIEIKSFNSFNCDGKGYFPLSQKNIQKLRESPLKVIRLINGRTYDYLTQTIENKYKNYFINLFNSYYHQLEYGFFNKYSSDGTKIE